MSAEEERRNSVEMTDVDLDDDRLGEPPIPNDFNVVREKPKSILTKRILACAVTCCCGVPIAITLFFVVLFTTLLMYGPYRANFSLKETHSPKVVHGQLSNGLKYAIRHNGVKSGKFSAYLQVNTGSTNEEENERGISHMVEHMAFDNSKQYHGRGGVWQQIFNAGLGYFNAYTSFRNTVYMFLDVIVDPKNPTDALNRIMNIFYNQVQNADIIDEYLQLEKGAVLGEARMRNNSLAYALEKALVNHSGGTWRTGSRFPIGTQEIIRSWKAQDLKNYYTKWYRLDKMVLYVVGDIDAKTIESAVKEYWEPKALLSGQPKETTPNKEIGKASPVEKFVLTEVDGINGVNMHMIITQPYVGYPRDVNYYRHEFGDTMFSYIYTVMVLARVLQEYPGTTLEELTTRNAAIASVNQYMFGSKLTIGSFLSPGPRPNSGTWRNDLSIYVEELKGLADDGPSSYTVLAMQFLLTILTQADDTQLDSTELITLLLGDEDPDHYYTDTSQLSDMTYEFIGLGFNKYFKNHVQSQAQLMYNTLHKLAYEDEPDTPMPYTSIIDVPEASFNIFVGRNEMPYNIEGITEKDVKEELKKLMAKGKSSLGLLAGLGADFSGLSSFGGFFYPLEPRPEVKTYTPKQIASDDELKLKIFELSNGIRVNIKANDANSAYPSGYSRMQVVSLGGRSTQSPDLKGACEFVNSAEPIGFRYYFNEEEYLYESGGSLIECTSDYLIIDTPLHAPCSSNALAGCDLQTFNYTYNIEQALLTMHPVYDNLAVEKVVKNWRKSAKITSAANEPLDVLINKAIPDAIGMAFKDSRFERVTVEDIEKLHPIAVQYWVSNQFQPDRMEVNVIGDVNNYALLQDLDRWLGNLPRKALVNRKVGYDIYSQDDVQHFDVAFPLNRTITQGCNLPNFAPDRGFVSSIFPAVNPYATDYPSVATADELLSSYLFDVIRSQNGYSYFALVEPKHSVVLPESSFYTVIWCSGDYPTPQNQSTDHLNIDSSQQTASNALRSQVPDHIIKNGKAAYLGQMSSSTQITSYYLEVMRGVSLKAPLFQQSSPNARRKEYIKTIEEINLPKQVKQQVKDSDLKNIFSSVMEHKKSEIRVSVAAVALSMESTCQ